MGATKVLGVLTRLLGSAITRLLGSAMSLTSKRSSRLKSRALSSSATLTGRSAISPGARAISRGPCSANGPPSSQSA